MAHFTTKYGTSGNRSEYFGIYDSEGFYIGSAYTFGKGWFIRGLFKEVSKSFSDSQVAIEQAVFVYQKEQAEYADRELMATF
ncbi:MAG: hypothetical protein ACRC62_18170 [Microcoleus sp.]